MEQHLARLTTTVPISRLPTSSCSLSADAAAAGGVSAVESPIDIDTARVITPDPWGRSIDLWGYDTPSQTVTMTYHGRPSCDRRHAMEDVRGEFSTRNRIDFGGREYELKNIHYHAVSEHNVDGVQLDGEAHLLHETVHTPTPARPRKLLVLAVRLTMSATNGSQHDALLANGTGAQALPSETCATPMSAVRPDIIVRDLLPPPGSAWWYRGSLTTKANGDADYHKPVDWIVFQETMAVDWAVWEHYRSIWPLRDFPNRNAKPATNASPIVTAISVC
ncbi:carbonic anhydrase [Sinosporangium album]|uniref:carbonic anhydrase n=1 Tax=Sinosporangium album TaxID=504805 RepID=A0A1G7QNK2_9ACTN|nr:carbonic anhydrase family protein [Sinosporangium album]SDG00096.1 carbonic anhydrase [Sinosporangium album]